ncbi:radical SAM protein, partial [Acetivibrio ethanolgignens]|uniref:radical SAM protein n=1 Tax=Acetivibrio ethanolgignens TaxID=290052 RepID=UPI0011C9943E
DLICGRIATGENYNLTRDIDSEKPSNKNIIDFSDVYDKDNWHKKRLTFRLTGNCNMACPYCFTNFHSLKSVIAPEYYKKAICDFVKQLKPDDIAGIIITGGEATLYKDLVIDIMQYATEKCSEHHNKVKFLLYTNFMLVDEHFLSKLSQYNVSIALSIDGDQAKHDANRINPAKTSSYKQILKNLLVASKYPSLSLEVRSVIQNNEDSIIGIINSNFALE